MGPFGPSVFGATGGYTYEPCRDCGRSVPVDTLTEWLNGLVQDLDAEHRARMRAGVALIRSESEERYEAD